MSHTSYMNLGELTPSRLSLAIELILDGRVVSYRDVGFAVREGVLHVEAESPCASPNLTQAQALAEIEHAERVLAALSRQPEFAEAVAGYPLRMSVIYDYGMGSVEICDFHNGKIRWASEKRVGDA